MGNLSSPSKEKQSVMKETSHDSKREAESIDVIYFLFGGDQLEYQ